MAALKANLKNNERLDDTVFQQSAGSITKKQRISEAEQTAALSPGVHNARIAAPLTITSIRNNPRIIHESLPCYSPASGLQMHSGFGDHRSSWHALLYFRKKDLLIPRTLSVDIPDLFATTPPCQMLGLWLRVSWYTEETTSFGTIYRKDGIKIKDVVDAGRDMVQSWNAAKADVQALQGRQNPLFADVKVVCGFRVEGEAWSKVVVLKSD